MNGLSIEFNDDGMFMNIETNPIVILIVIFESINISKLCINLICNFIELV